MAPRGTPPGSGPQLQPDDAQALAEPLAAVAAAHSSEQLVVVRGQWLGREGQLGRALRTLGSATVAERRERGQALNRQRGHLEDALRRRQAELDAQQEETALAAGAFDVSLPGRQPPQGVPHPIMSTWHKIVQCLRPLGFEVGHGPEVEHDWYNFTALNMPADHPARDMQDTFFVGPEVVLRTHTSNVQVRAMTCQLPPVRILAPGMVFRRDEVDATHSPVFHQVEGLWVDEQATFAELKGVLGQLMGSLFGASVAMRYRPSYFPFTEPSCEVDIRCTECGPKGAARQQARAEQTAAAKEPAATTTTAAQRASSAGTCRVCRGTGWLEVLGAGMVDPAVLEAVGYDPQKVGGFAFGLGIERICMLQLGLDDMRVLYDNEAAVMAQLAGQLPTGRLC